MEKTGKNNRILNLYVDLCEGKVVNKIEEAERFGVDERSVQRDINEIRAFLSERRSEKGTDTRGVVYKRNQKGYVLEGETGSLMTNSEILAVSKILLESRAFSKKEITEILDKLVKGCVPLKNIKLVSDLIANEKYHYVELHHQSYVQEKMWAIGNDIKEHNVIEIEYIKAEATEETVKRVIEPVAILFSEYYFYLNAFIVEPDAQGNLVHKYDYPAIFRIDRIKDYKETGDKFRIAYASRFEEGEFRKKIQFMYPGQLMNIRIKYFGHNPEAILDRLPTARIASQTEDECIIDAEVYGKGIVMWLMSQTTKVEVLKPKALREEMKRLLEKMLERYV